MKIGLNIGYSGANFDVDIALIQEAERLGFESAWTSEAYGSDAVTPAAWVLAQTSKIRVGTAIMQMPARTPTMTAMTAMTMNALSGGRFALGIGPSGPQVVEGWYGEAYGRPMTRTREYVDIVRKILAREEPLTHEGFHYQIPFTGEGASGLGKPLKSILHNPSPLKIFTGTISPVGVRTAAEIADGFFPVWMSPESFSAFEEPLKEGFANAGGGKSLKDFEILPFVRMVMGDDLEACRLPVKQHLALYVGGMGARNKNFYNDYVKRMGYEDAAETIQNLYLDGEKDAAIAAVPDELVDAVALVGPKERIAEGLQAWKATADRGEISGILIGGATVEGVRIAAEAVL